MAQQYTKFYFNTYIRITLIYVYLSLLYAFFFFFNFHCKLLSNFSKFTFVSGTDLSTCQGTTSRCLGSTTAVSQCLGSTTAAPCLGSTSAAPPGANPGAAPAGNPVANKITAKNMVTTPMPDEECPDGVPENGDPSLLDEECPHD